MLLLHCSHNCHIFLILLFPEQLTESLIAEANHFALHNLIKPAFALEFSVMSLINKLCLLPLIAKQKRV